MQSHCTCTYLLWQLSSTHTKKIIIHFLKSVCKRNTKQLKKGHRRLFLLDLQNTRNRLFVHQPTTLNSKTETEKIQTSVISSYAQGGYLLQKIELSRFKWLRIKKTMSTAVLSSLTHHTNTSHPLLGLRKS